MVGHKTGGVFNTVQKKRLARSGYWLNLSNPKVSIDLIHISIDHEIYYTRSGLLAFPVLGKWAKMNWKSAPTKVTTKNSKTLIYFDTYELVSDYIKVYFPEEHNTLTKAPSDKEHYAYII